MAKFLIPSILAATILIAGAFALSPVEEAMTIHLTGGGAPAGANTVDSAAIINGEIVSADLSAIADITGTQLSATANIAGSQLSATANIAGSQLSATANIAGSQLSATAGIISGQIADNAITGADLQGTTSATAAIPTRSASSTAATVLSTAFSPAAASTVIVIASADVLEAGVATVNLILTITENGANCAVIGGAAFQTALASTTQGAISGMAVFTGCDDANIVFTSTLTASGTFGDTVNRHNITTIWLEQ